ncbi:class I SAM-dependent methyltransferase [Candidatus Bathyarchaeota archaeon]|nr:class I SAM-dependent methyltransferase [Candidatus Bathyarchaeota archaeon]
MNAVIKRFLMKSLVKLSRKPQAKVSLKRLDGFVVDIGAGGEGTIAKTCGRETVCVDISKREIGEARSRGAVANWVLCDACSMPFRNGTFDVATFFFSLMYIKTFERKQAVMREAKRVLKSDGLLYLWDATIREKPDLYVVFVEANLPDGEKIYTGYGVKGKEKEQTLELINKLALEAGFRVTGELYKNEIFQLEMQK